MPPIRDHLFRLMLDFQKNELLVWELLRLFAHDAPLDESIVVVLPSHVSANLVLSRFSPSSHAILSLSTYSILFLSLYLCIIHLLHCCLFC